MQIITSLFLLFSSLAFASNGKLFIGISPVSNSMGGTGVANATTSVDAAYKNPALFSELPLQKGAILADAGFSIIKQNTSADNSGLGSKSSSAGLGLPPALSAAYKATENLSVGLSAFTYGGARTDYTGEASLQEIKVSSSLTQIGPTASYKLFDMWSLGISPHLVYADLSLNSKNAVTGAAQTDRPAHGTLAYGVKFGTAVTPLKDLTVGFSFSPKVRIRYKEVLDLDALNLLPAALGGTSGAGDGKLDDIDSEDPAQFALGVSYVVIPALKVTVDGRLINWSNADVFKELGWRDQYVIALGAEYRLDKWAIRAGFNYARSLIDGTSGENGFTNISVSGHNISQQSVSTLGLVGLPGFATTHLCAGTGYDFTKDITGDLSFIYVPESTVTRSGTGVAPTLTAGPYSYTGKVSQWYIGLGATYRL